MNERLLLVQPPHRRRELLGLLDGKSLQISTASDFREAQKKLNEETFDLLLADAELPDGSWRDLLQLNLRLHHPCEMIVCSPCGDEELWAEALQRGAYDLLVEPFSRQEVYRIIRSALDNRYIRRFTALAAS
jgi:DNA-binding NtrC family response regulator